MKKRIICLFLTVVLCFSLMPSTALASDTTATPCYIASSNCPETYIQYARENISRFVVSMNEDLTSSTVSVGTPFAFAAQDADIFYFPVITDGSIKYLFRVYPNGDSLCGAITEFLTAELNELAPLTSAVSPIYLKSINDRIVATVGNRTYELFQYPVSMSKTAEAAVFTAAIDYPVRNVTTASDIVLDLRQTRDVSNYIPLNIIETQGNNGWCTAYCLATIIRTQTTFYTTAYSLMIDALGSNPDTNTGFPWFSDYGVTMRRTLNKYGLSPTIRVTTVPNSTLIQEIVANRPCLVSMTDNNDVYHSVVLRGWSSLGIWSIWNPWYNYYENYPIDGIYVLTDSTGTYELQPRGHVYGFA